MEKRRLVLYGSIVISTIVVSFYGGTVARLIFFTSLFLPILSWVYLLYVYIRFRIYQIIETKTMVKGEHIPYYFQLSNEDYIAYTNVRVSFVKQYAIVESLKEEDTYCLLPGESIKRETTICCKYRGEYSVGIDTVIVRDLFQLFELQYQCDSKINVRVLPRVIEVSELSIAPEDVDLKEQLQRMTKNEVIPDVELRKYVAGDPRKRIHFKASAKMQQWMTRKYMEEPKSEIIYVMDLVPTKKQEPTKIMIEDQVIECSLAIINYFCRHQTPTKVVYGTEQVEVVTIHSKQDFDGFYGMVSEVRFRSNYSLDQLLVQCAGRLHTIGYYVVVTANLDSACLRSIEEILSYGNDVTVIYVGKESAIDNMSHIDQRIHFYKLPLEKQISEVLSVARRNL